MFKIILEDLKQAVGGRIVITPEELEGIMGISSGHQANMRCQNRFPIPHQKVGRKVHYSLHAVAKHLVSSASAHSKAGIKDLLEDAPLTRQDKKKKGNHLEAGWWVAFRPRLLAVFEKLLLTSDLPEVPKKRGKVNP